MERISVSLRPRGMTGNLFGHAPAPRSLRAGLAVALLLPLLAACGSGTAGGSGGSAGSGSASDAGASGGPESPAPSPAGVPDYCGLDPEGTPERTEGGMTFPATLDYVGKSEADATALAESRKLTVRVVGKDGECGMVTDDLRTDRVNLYLEDGTVTAAGAF
jgi:hypothetical protein